MKMGTVIRNIPRSAPEQLGYLQDSGVSTVYEAMGRRGLMESYMRPIQTGKRIAGNAVTVLVHPGDYWMIDLAVELCQPDYILVVATTQECTDGMFEYL